MWKGFASTPLSTLSICRQGAWIVELSLLLMSLLLVVYLIPFTVFQLLVILVFGLPGFPALLPCFVLRRGLQVRMVLGRRAKPAD